MLLNKAVYRRLSNAFVLKRFMRLSNVFVLKWFRRLANVFLFIKQKYFVLDNGPLVEIPMVSFSLWA